MTTNMIDRYRRWFDYEKEVHQKVIASLRVVPDEGRASASYQKAVDLFAHIIVARMMWLFRLGVVSEAPRELFPQAVKVDTLDRSTEKMHSAWMDYLGGLDDADLARVFEYHRPHDGSYRNSVEDVLTQLFGHSLYHRGQIALLLRSIGSEPAATDFVFWCRQPGFQQTASS